MDANIGPDEPVVFSGSLQLSTAANGAGPLDFDVVFNSSTPFVYTASAGNLLVESRLLDPTALPGAPFLDSVTATGDAISTAFNLVQSPVTLLPTQGLVTRFECLAPPGVPALDSVALRAAAALIGLTGGVALRLRRTALRGRGR